MARRYSCTAAAGTPPTGHRSGGLRPGPDRNGNPVTEGGNNVYELYNLAAGRCLAVTATRVAQPLILTSCVTTSTSVALWELRPTTPASHDFQLALWLYDDWCIGANDFNDNSPTRLLLFGCSPSDTSQLWNLG